MSCAPAVLDLIAGFNCENSSNNQRKYRNMLQKDPVYCSDVCATEEKRGEHKYRNSCGVEGRGRFVCEEAKSVMCIPDCAVLPAAPALSSMSLNTAALALPEPSAPVLLTVPVISSIDDLTTTLGNDLSKLIAALQ